MPKYRTAALLGTAVIALAGCSSGAPTGPRPSASAGAGLNDARATWLRVSQCMRANGYPDFPDPTLDEHGVWNISYPIQGESPAACDQAVREAKAISNSLTGVTPSEMAGLRQYAACMRSHGIAAFPDPDEDGNYGPVLQQLAQDPAYPAAFEACKQLHPPQRPK
jgi:hypothetical protein